MTPVGFGGTSFADYGAFQAGVCRFTYVAMWFSPILFPWVIGVGRA